MFGELALLYGAKRAASIACVEQGLLYSLDRQTFNSIVTDAGTQKREEMKTFISGLDLFRSIIDEYEVNKICDAFERETFKKSEMIIWEGEIGEDFYLIVNGQAYATKTLQPGGTPELVAEMREGQYFGERALIKNAPRAANVIAETDLTLLKLNRRAFKRLLGPIKPFLERNMVSYTSPKAEKAH